MSVRRDVFARTPLASAFAAPAATAREADSPQTQPQPLQAIDQSSAARG